MLGHMKKCDDDWETFDLVECVRDIFVCTIKGAVHDLFYKLLQKNKLHNLNVRTENNKIVQFNIGGITIQETQHIKMCQQQ